MRKPLFLAAITFALGCSSANTNPDAGSPDVGLDLTGAVDLPLVPDLIEIADAGSDAPEDRSRDSVGVEARAPGIARLSPSTPYVTLGTIDMVAGGTSAVTVTNHGDVNTGALSITTTAGLGVAGCTQPLDPGESCILTIIVRPTATGEFTGTIRVSANPGTITQFELSVSATVEATNRDASPGIDTTTVVDQGSPLTPSEFFEERAKAVCFAVSLACLITTASCTPGRVAEYKAAYEDALRKSRSFVPSNAQTCLAKVGETYDQLLRGGAALKAADYQAMEAACANVYRGTGAPNGACLADVDCADDLVCDKGYCGTYKLVSEGTECGNVGESCPEGFFCSNVGGVWTCAAKVGAQGSCAASPCLESLRCADAVCSARLGIGESCQSDGDCASGFCEPFVDKCASDIRHAAGSAACIAMDGA